MSSNTIYQFSAQTISGQEISLSNYQNKVLLIVNTASECSFTPQIKDLVTLKNDFSEKDFEILSFPSNDFGGQEPLESEAIVAFFEKYGTNFPIFEKMRVRGPYAHPLYKFFADKKENGVLSSVPRWNFHKFLISRAGMVTDFFYPFTSPTSSKIRKKIGRLLAADH